ncbi:hypothetical protein [Phormidesmis sp. 146-33]
MVSLAVKNDQFTLNSTVPAISLDALALNEHRTHSSAVFRVAMEKSVVLKTASCELRNNQTTLNPASRPLMAIATEQRGYQVFLSAALLSFHEI